MQDLCIWLRVLCLPGVLSFNCNGERRREDLCCVQMRVSHVLKRVCVTVFVSTGGNLDLVLLRTNTFLHNVQF